MKKTLNDSGKKINYVFEDNADWSTETAEKYFELFLKTGQKADAVACNNDDMALGIVNACENNNISLDSVPVIGVDATEKGCKSIAEGKMAFTIYQSGSGQGEYLIKAAIRHLHMVIPLTDLIIFQMMENMCGFHLKKSIRTMFQNISKQKIYNRYIDIYGYKCITDKTPGFIKSN